MIIVGIQTLESDRRSRRDVCYSMSVESKTHIWSWFHCENMWWNRHSLHQVKSPSKPDYVLQEKRETFCSKIWFNTSFPYSVLSIYNGIREFVSNWSRELISSFRKSSLKAVDNLCEMKKSSSLYIYRNLILQIIHFLNGDRCSTFRNVPGIVYRVLSNLGSSLT